MSIGAPFPNSLATGGPAAALPDATQRAPQLAPDIRAVVAELARAPGLTEPERTTLVQASATASAIADSAMREVALRQVSGMGLYLSKTGDSGLPRWTMMTALRAYGLNIPERPAPERAAQNTQAVRDAQLSRQVTEAVARAQALRVQQAQTPQAPPPPAAPPVQPVAPPPVREVAAQPRAENSASGQKISKLV